MQQCRNAETIKLRYGLHTTFDYAVGGKLRNFTQAAARHPDFAPELPRFVSRVRHLFTAQEIQTHLARIKRERKETGLAEVDDEGFDFS